MFHIYLNYRAVFYQYHPSFYYYTIYHNSPYTSLCIYPLSSTTPSPPPPIPLLTPCHGQGHSLDPSHSPLHPFPHPSPTPLPSPLTYTPLPSPLTYTSSFPSHTITTHPIILHSFIIPFILYIHSITVRVVHKSLKHPNISNRTRIFSIFSCLRLVAAITCLLIIYSSLGLPFTHFDICAHIHIYVPLIHIVTQTGHAVNTLPFPHTTRPRTDTRQ